jgi:hypothetical protein
VLEDLGLECPKCGSPLQASLADVANERTKRCPRGHTVNLKDTGGGAKRVKKATDDLDRALEGLNKTIKFKF